MRQYVGPRCIPDVTGQLHDITQSYENLIVVDNGMGTSYISRKPVPPGIPLTNTEYWGLFGATNGAIINLQNQIGDLNSLNTTDKDSLVDAINETVSEISTLTNRVYFDVPENYGAVGDGVADDTDALQDCFTNSTKNIFLLRNKYKVSGKIDLPSDITIIGTNDTEIIDAWYGTSMGDNQYDAIFDGRNVKNITIDNITFKGIAIGAVQSSSMNWRCDICFRNSSGINIKNCKFIACDQYTQIALRACENCVISNNQFEWYRYQGIVLFSSHDCVVNENTFSDCGCDYINTYAICFTYVDVSNLCYNMKCLNNIIKYPNRTANWESIDAHGLLYSEVAGNIITDCNDGIALLTEYTRGFQCQYLDIHDNYIRGGAYNGKTNYGIISGGYNINIYNNTVNNCGLNTAAITLISLIRECTIKNNHIVSARDKAIMLRRDSSWNQYIQNLIIENNDVSIVPSSGTEGVFIHCYDTTDPSFYGCSYCKNNVITTGNLSKLDITLPTAMASASAFLEFDNNNYGGLVPSYNTFLNCSPDLIHTADIANVGNRGPIGHVVKVVNFTNTSGSVYELRKTDSNIIPIAI